MLKGWRTILLIVLTTNALAPGAAFARDGKSGGSAFFKSLLVPGWGQYTTGHKSSALAFFGADLALVGGMLTLSSYGRSTSEDYKALASAFAGVSGDHAHDFYVDVGNWMTVDQYNERRLQNREYDALYTSPRDRWSWDTEAHRSQMESIRIKSDRAYNSILYLVGGMVLNHVASAIHAARLTSQEAKSPQASLKPPAWNVDVQPVNITQGLRVRISHSF